MAGATDAYPLTARLRDKLAYRKSKLLSQFPPANKYVLSVRWKLNSGRAYAGKAMKQYHTSDEYNDNAALIRSSNPGLIPASESAHSLSLYRSVILPPCSGRIRRVCNRPRIFGSWISVWFFL
jgi:hypothetical protein